MVRDDRRTRHTGRTPMRRILIGIIGAALLAAFACSSNESTGSIAGPSAIPGATINGPLGNGCQSSTGNGNDCYTFKATPVELKSGSKWHGNSEPTVIPAKGHPGHVTMTFGEALTIGADLSWSGFQTGGNAHCTISDGHGTVVDVSCHDTLKPQNPTPLTVYPSETTEYTFTDTWKDTNSNQHGTQTAKVTVTITSSVNSKIDVLWEPKEGYRTDDPTLAYKGTATGPFSNLQVSGISDRRCGLGGGNMYSHLHAVMTLEVVDQKPKLKATYTGMTDVQGTCSAADGRVDLIIDDGKPM